MSYRDFDFKDAGASHVHRHFMPPLLALSGQVGPGTRVLDVGCGNGFTAGQFLERGCEVTGIDLSEQGFALARATYPKGRFEILPADNDLLANFDCHPLHSVVSTEVVEHLYAPRPYIAGCFAALRPGGRLVLSTPYHGYLKNLVLSLAGKWDHHADPLWDGGHIKLWNRQILSHLLTEAGFADLQFRGAGRLPGLWMTMLMSGTRPA